jgi:hypothetical protein
MTKLSQVDRDAMKRAIEIVRQRDAASRDQIDHKLRDEPWQEVGEFAAYSCQCDSLHLKPWQDPPCVINLASALREPFGDQRAEREAAELLKKILAAGLSRYEGDPLQALDRAKEAR